MRVNLVKMGPFRGGSCAAKCAFGSCRLMRLVQEVSAKGKGDKLHLNECEEWFREKRPETSYILLLWWHKFSILVYVTKEVVTTSTINQTTYLTISALLSDVALYDFGREIGKNE